MTKFIQRGYLQITSPNKIKSFIDYFAVKKGESDIRVVFNGTSCGFNSAIWAPNFWLPMSSSMVRVLSYNYDIVDIDLGEMFINFTLVWFFQQYSGVDLSPMIPDLLKTFPELQSEIHDKRLTSVWTRDWMGFKSSPYWVAKFYYLAEEFIRGDESDTTNPLYWNEIKLNLLGNLDYNPAYPNVIKFNSFQKLLAGDIKAYVDDLRTMGNAMEQAWAIARCVAARLQYLGIQDAPRKRRVHNGPWAGTVYLTHDGGIRKTVTEKKWEKGRNYIQELVLETTSNQLENITFNYKRLEVICGFLCHLAMTYELLFPFLKGFHLTLAQHLPCRDSEGWKIKEASWIAFCHRENIPLGDESNDHPPPVDVKPVPRFFKCLKALNTFFKPTLPPIVTERSLQVFLVLYGFADASKSGFGASLQTEQ